MRTLSLYQQQIVSDVSKALAARMTLTQVHQLAQVADSLTEDLLDSPAYQQAKQEIQSQGAYLYTVSSAVSAYRDDLRQQQDTDPHARMMIRRIQDPDDQDE